MNEKIRERHPVIQCITNIVTANDCANILLAAGASATMASHPMEVAEIAANVDGLVLNMGAIANFESMLIAGRSAKKNGHAIVVDPVGVAASSYRREQCLKLINEVKPTAIRGNVSEITALIIDENTSKSVDDPSNVELTNNLKQDMMYLADKWNTILVASGAVDYITDGDKWYENSHGDAMMSRITGSGCMSSALLCAYLATDHSVESAYKLTETMGIAGEIAAKRTCELNAGTMTFRQLMIDEISK